LIAQLVAEKQELAGMVLLCPILPGQIRVLPDKRMVKSGIKLIPAFFLGKPLKVSRNSYQELGLNQLPESLVDTVYPKIVPWPNRLARQLLIPPRVAIERVCCPVLVVAGKEDRLVPWEKARVLGDLYEGVVWRYDKLAHMPPWEPLSERVASDILSWCQTPSRPQVLESEGFGPKEGVGHGLRRQRRGEEMKRRSAYGQKDSTRKKS
jgi:pimeloyl-ACP methyl ester carboxylesterase